jgi:hypothetical protein
LRAGQYQPGRAHYREENAGIDKSIDKQARSTGRRDQFSRKNGTNEQSNSCSQQAVQGAISIEMIRVIIVGSNGSKKRVGKAAPDGPKFACLG